MALSNFSTSLDKLSIFFRISRCLLQACLAQLNVLKGERYLANCFSFSLVALPQVLKNFADKTDLENAQKPNDKYMSERTDFFTLFSTFHSLKLENVGMCEKSWATRNFSRKNWNVVKAATSWKMVGNFNKSVVRNHLLRLKSSSVTNILVYFQYIIMMFSTLNFFLSFSSS